MTLPIIETLRLRLRPVTLTDLDYFYLSWNEPQVRKYLWDDEPVAKERVEAALIMSIKCFENYSFGIWGVILKERSSLIGFSGLRYVEGTPDIELLYGLAPQYYNQGLSTEAAKAVLKYGFEELGLYSIVGTVNPNNIASWRVLEKAGMKFERSGLSDIEELHYSISREAFQPDNTFGHDISNHLMA